MFAQVLGDPHAMPQAMFAPFAMWIYTAAAVTQVHYDNSDSHSAAYNEGANWVGALFAAYNGFAALALGGVSLIMAGLCVLRVREPRSTHTPTP